MKKRISLFVLACSLLYSAAPAGAAEKNGREIQDETIYSVITDRFNNGNSSNDYDVDSEDLTAYNGGDFSGLTKKLDYLNDMGFTAISLSPIFDNQEGGYHGRWAADFTKLDEHLGTMKDLKNLVKEAHKRDMKVLAEFNANSTGPDSPWLEDPAKQEWFHEKNTGSSSNDKEMMWADNLPDLNQDNPETREYLLDAASYWINEADLDGYRLLYADNVPLDFWKDFSKKVKNEKKDFYLIAEAGSLNKEQAAAYQKAGIDSLMDFSQNEELRADFQKTNVPLTALFKNGKENEEVYPHSERLSQFMDTADMPRFTSLAAAQNLHPGARWKQALTYLYTTPGIPLVYYGSEIALNGEKEPENRQFMDFRTDQDLIDYITDLGRLRAELPALTRGDMELLYEKDGMAVYKRTYQDETIVAVINNTSKTQKVVLDGKLEEGKELKGLLNGDLVRSEGDRYTIVMDREKSEIYALTDKTGFNMSFVYIIGGILVLFAVFIGLLMRRAKRKG